MRLFVYGTLLEGSDTSWSRWLRARVSKARRGSVSGRLFAIPTDVGWYPALVAGAPHERAWGMACDLALRAGDLARLDRYEGREYVRVMTQVQAAGAQAPRRFAAQTYRWRARLPAGALPIAGGDFIAWLQKTGSRPYASRTNSAV